MPIRQNQSWLLSLKLSLAFLLVSFLVDEASLKIYFQVCLLIFFIAFFTISLRRFSCFEPSLFFLLLFAAYFFVGGFNYSSLPFFDVSYKYEMCAVIFIAGFSIPMILFKESKAKVYKVEYASITLCLILLLFGPLNWAVIGGVPVFMGEDARRSANAVVAVLFQTGWVLSIYLTYSCFALDRGMTRKLMLFISSLYALLLFFSGYRTPLLIGIMLWIFLYFSTAEDKRSTALRLFLIGAGLLVIINLISVIRVFTEYGYDGLYKVSSLFNFGDGSLFFYLLFPLISNLKESALNFQLITATSFSFGGGEYFFANILSILPGYDMGYGSLYNKLTLAESDRTKTASLVAPGYIFLGYSGVFISAVFLGAIAALISRIKTTLFFCGCFGVNSLYFSFLAAWIHTGIIFQPGNYLLFFLLGLIFIGLKIIRKGSRHAF